MRLTTHFLALALLLWIGCDPPLGNQPPADDLDDIFLAFSTNRDGNWELYTADEPGGDWRIWASSPQDEVSPRFSADGEWLVFASNRTGNWDIFAVHLTDGTVTQLTSHPGDDQNPEWSADGAIAFESTRFGNADLFVIGPNGVPTPLTLHLSADLSPQFDPAGERVAFVSLREGSADIFLRVLNQSTIVRLTSGSDQELQPRWSPDGGRIAYTTHRSAVENLFVLDLNSGTTLMVTDHPSDEQEPVWSPAGDFLYYRTFQDGQIYRVPSAGGTPEKLTFIDLIGSFSLSELVITPDGTGLAFVSDHDGVKNIYLLDTVAGGIRKLIGSAGEDLSPQFRPQTVP